MTDAPARDLAVVEAGAPPVALTRDLLPTEDPIEAGRRVDARIAFFKAIREKTVALTYPHDWEDFDGKPYLKSTGVERLAPLWGIYIESIRMEPTLEETRRRLRMGEHVTVEVLAFAGSRVTGERAEFIGGRSSDDPFWSNRAGGIATLDPEDLRKAAFSNFEVQVVTRLLGLRGMTWEDLKRYGIDRSGGEKFAKGGATGGQDRRATMAAELKASLLARYGEEPKALAALWSLSRFTDDKGQERGLKTWADAEKATEKWLTRLLDKMANAPKPSTPAPSPSASSPAPAPEQSTLPTS